MEVGQPGNLLERRRFPRGPRLGALYPLGCMLVVAACVLLTRPFLEMGVLDDWSYIRTAQDFASTGHIVYNGFATAMLGWVAPLGALGIMLFGFSFSAARLYMLPMTLAGVWLMFRVLRNFGVEPNHAAFGTLLLFLSPICLPLEFVAMTDIPGLVAVLLCLLFCQKAVQSEAGRSAILWLCAATAANLVGGTARQIAWLGALVMVPSTAWLLRRGRGVLPAGILLGVGSAACVLVMLRWFYRQPHAVPEKLMPAHLDGGAIIHLASQMAHLGLCLALLLLPLTIAWLWQTRQRGRSAQIRLLCVALLATVFFAGGPRGAGWHTTRLVPFVPHILGALGMDPRVYANMLGYEPPLLPDALRVALSVLCVVCAYACIDFLVAQRRASIRESKDPTPIDSSAAVVWMLGPFLLANIVFLIPRGLTAKLYDRYLYEIMAVLIVLLLRVCRQRVRVGTSRVAIAALAVFTVWTVAATHDWFAMYRARIAAGEELMAQGVPRTSFSGGFEMDGWTELESSGFVRDTPDIGWDDHVRFPDACHNWFKAATSSIHPRYYILKSQVVCFAPSSLPDVIYRAWLPPFRRRLYVETMLPQYRGYEP